MGEAETLGVVGLNLSMEKDKHRANLYSQRVQQAKDKKQIERSRRKRKRSRAGRRLARAAIRLTRERQKTALVKVATYNVRRRLSLKEANDYGRDEVVLHEAAANHIAVLGIQERGDQSGQPLQQQGSAYSTAVRYKVGNRA